MKFLILLLLISAGADAQQLAGSQATRTSIWFSPQAINFAALAPAPPATGSEEDRRDLQDVLLAQSKRTATQVEQAKADDKEEDIFIFSSILGPSFSAAELPLTAAFSQRLREASAVINPPLKLHFARRRPLVASAAVHPVCEMTGSESFPSGHSMVGTLEALALTQILPERSAEILQRLDQYTRGRVICGVHYPSDVAASKVIASSLFGLIAASPAFQSELAASKAEVRRHLGFTLAPSAETEKAGDARSASSVR